MKKGITPGLGVTYSPQNGWGGSIGLGNTTQNASISFSQRGDTTVQGSYSLAGGVQLAGDITTNGAANIGLNYNPTGEGPRRDWNFSLMYDMAGTGLSASAGYTHPGSTMGLTTTVNRDGMSTSAELTGVSIATNGPNGFQMDEINFAEQNINAAQDKTQDDQNKAKLIASGQYSADEVANMNGQEIDNALGELPKETPNVFDAFLGSIGNYIDNNINTGIDLAVSIGGSIAGGAALLYGIGSNPGSSNNNPPNTQNVVATEPNRKREDEDSDVADNQDLDRTNDQPDSDLVEINKYIQDLKEDLSKPIQLTEAGETPSEQGSKGENESTNLSQVTRNLARKEYILTALTEMFKGGKVDAQYFADNFGILSKSLDPVTLTKIQSLVEKSYQRVKDDSGRLVFSQDQVSIFNQQTSVVINGILFVKETGKDYFTSEKLKDGNVHAIQLTAEGKIKQMVLDEKKSKVLATKIFDAKGKEIRRDAGKSNTEIFNILESYDSKLEHAKKVFALEDAKTTKKMIESSNLDSETQKQLTKDLNKFITEWGNNAKNDLLKAENHSVKEKAIHEKYELKIIDSIKTNDKVDDTSIIVGSTFKTNVYIAEATISPDISQAMNMPDFSDKLHYEPSAENNYVSEQGGSGKYKVDLNADYNGKNDMMWFGPNASFKVIDIGIEGHEEFNQKNLSAHGTAVTIQLFKPDGSPDVKLKLVHLTTISKELIDNFKNGSNAKPLPAGTWLGATPTMIGSTTGPHLHIEGVEDSKDGKKVPRPDIYEKWSGK